METTAVNPADFARIEQKLDKLGDAVGKLVLVEERQTNQSARLDKHDMAIEAAQNSISRAHARIDKVIWLWTGGSFVMVGIFELARFFSKA